WDRDAGDGRPPGRARRRAVGRLGPRRRDAGAGARADRARRRHAAPGSASSMKRGVASRLAWSIGTSSIALMIGSLVLAYLDRHTRLPDGAASQAWNVSNVLNVVVNIAVPSIGILLGSRRPENPLGWVFLTAGATIGLSYFGLAYGVHALVAHHGSLPAGRALAWVGSAVGAIPIGM